MGCGLREAREGVRRKGTMMKTVPRIERDHSVVGFANSVAIGRLLLKRQERGRKQSLRKMGLSSLIESLSLLPKKRQRHRILKRSYVIIQQRLGNARDT